MASELWRTIIDKMPLRLIDILVISAAVMGGVTFLRRRSRSARKTKLPGPPRQNLLWGYSRMLLSGRMTEFVQPWQKEYGNVMRVPFAFGREWNMFLDLKAIHYIVNTNADNFQRHTGARMMFARTLGPGILSAEGDDHKRFRKTMSPGFSSASLRYFASLFMEIVQKTKSHWLERMEGEGKDEITIDAEQCLKHISFDSMGQAGFSHNFNAVDGSNPRVAVLFDSFSGGFFTILRRLMMIFLADSWIAKIIPMNQLVDKMRDEMTAIAKNILRDEGAKAEVGEGRRSLMASIIKEENRKLSEEEVVAQMNTLIFAAYQTTSTSLTWAFHELSLHPDVQAKLREDVRRFGNLTPLQMENELPYLDAFVKECLRFHPTVPGVRREVVVDDSIPLSAPLLTADGKLVDHIDLPAGVEVMIPIEPINRAPEIWGTDAGEFRPERWLEPLPQAVEGIRGWHHTMTFLDGPKNCIGRNFAVAEMKAVVATLVRDFSIQPLTDGSDVNPKLAFFVRPRNDNMNTLMLRIKKVDTD